LFFGWLAISLEFNYVMEEVIGVDDPSLGGHGIICQMMYHIKGQTI